MNEIEELLFAHVQTVTDALSVSVKWPNRNGPTDAATWLDVVHIPNGEALPGWNDLKANQGLLNLGVYVSPDVGATTAAPIISALAAAFAQATVLHGTTTKVEIYAPPRIGRVFEDGQKAVFPLSVRYRAFEG